MQGSIAAEQLLRRVEMCKKMGIALPHQAITLPPASTHASTLQALLYMEVRSADVNIVHACFYTHFCRSSCLVRSVKHGSSLTHGLPTAVAKPVQLRTEAVMKSRHALWVAAFVLFTSYASSYLL